MSQDTERLFIAIAVAKGFVTAQEGEDCRRASAQARELGAGIPITQLALNRGLLSPEQVRLIRTEMHRRGVFPRVGGYEIVAKLGQGGMGAVYKARQISLGREVALKMLPAELARNPEFVARFRREAMLAAQVIHPNAVQVYDTGEDGGHHFIVMEYVEGSSVDKLMAPGPVEEPRALDIVEGVAQALAAAHRKGIIHRDIKPANILLDGEGRAKLADLGIAKQTGQGTFLTRTGLSVGTPHYMSPEQCEGSRDIDGRADLYSLGATLFHMLCGRPVFEGDSTAAVVHKQVYQAPPDPRALNPAISEPTARLILRLLEKQRDNRPRDASELAALVRGILAGAGSAPPARTQPQAPLGSAWDSATVRDSVQARPEGVRGAGEPGASAKAVSFRGRVTAWGAGAAVLGVVCVLAVLFWGNRLSERARPAPPPVARPAPEPLVPAAPPPEQPRPASASAPAPETADAPGAKAPSTIEAPPPDAFDVRVWDASKSRVVSICVREGQVWLGTKAGIARYDPAEKSWSCLDQRHGTPLSWGQCLVDGDGHVWLCDSSDLFELAGKDWSQRRRSVYLKLHMDGQNRVWMGRSVGRHPQEQLVLLSGEGQREMKLPPELGGRVLCVTSAANGDVVAPCLGGVAMVPGGIGDVSVVPYPKPLPESASAWAAVDSTGAAWISFAGCSESNGLWTLDRGKLQRPAQGKTQAVSWSLLSGPIVEGKPGAVTVLCSEGVYDVSKGAVRCLDGSRPPRSPRWTLAARHPSGSIYAAGDGPTGLWRFDGKTWTMLRQEAPLPAPALSILAAQDGAVWVGTDQGLARLRGETWQTFCQEDTPFLQKSDTVWRLAQGAGGTVAMRTITDLTLLAGEKNTVFAAPPGSGNGGVRDLAESAGAWWQTSVQKDQSLCRMQNGKWESWGVGKDGLISHGRLAISPGGDVVFAPLYSNVIQRFDGQRWSREQLTTAKPHAQMLIYDAKFDRRGRLWVAFSGGAMEMVAGIVEGGAVNTEVPIPITHREDRPHQVKFDAENRLWVSCVVSGVQRWDGMGWRRFGAREGLISDQVSDFDFAPDGSVWVASWTGVSQIRFKR